MRTVLTGSIAIDRIMVFPGRFSQVIQADKLHVLSLSVLIDQLKDTPGGVAANIAYTLALLEEKPVLYGSIGKEAASYIDDLAKMGINTEFVHFSDLPTATFTVMTDQADCQIGGFYPGAMSDASLLTFNEFNEEDFFVISPHDPAQMAKQVQVCKNKKFRMFYDVGQQVSNVSAEDLRAGMDAAELLIVNDYEMGVLIKKTGWTHEEIISKLKTCVVTLGEKGCKIYHQGHPPISVPAVPIDKVVDPTGAGDAFRAGFLCGYVRDFPVEECAEYGSIAAAYCIGQLGTQTHTFTTEEFFARHKTNYAKE